VGHVQVVVVVVRALQKNVLRPSTCSDVVVVDSPAHGDRITLVAAGVDGLADGRERRLFVVFVEARRQGEMHGGAAEH